MDKVKSIYDIKLIPDNIGEAGIEKDFRVEPGVMTEILADKGLQVREPFQIHYEVLRHQENIHVSVDVKGVIRTTCSRCLFPMAHTVELNLDSDYMPAPPEMEEEHLEAERVSEDTGYFHREIKLGEYIISELVLSLPYVYICSESCKGLCQQCGANLNERPCACVQSTDPRLQVLSQLKNKL
jgi:uncharacterized protein